MNNLNLNEITNKHNLDGINTNGLCEFKEYDSQLHIPEVAGTRIVKCLYQENKKTGKKAGTNSYIRIPVGHLTEDKINGRMVELLPFIQTYLKDIESLIVKSRHKDNETSLSIQSLSIDSIIEYLEANSVSGRMSGDDIKNWYKSNLYDSLQLLFAEKLGLNESSSDSEWSKLETILAGYCKKFMSLASPKTGLSIEECEALLNVMTKADIIDNDIVAKRFAVRLQKMITNVNSIDLMML